eukprot:snap_masked-scaffold_30-processed-gene-3.104-mRNA-1 protein AED:1.00 eAED:1.00 QI:0/-1/0/0/-1/1/1/0/195
MNSPKIVNAAGGKSYQSTQKGTFDAVLDNNQRIILEDVATFNEIDIFLVLMTILMSKGLCLTAKENSISISKDESLLHKAEKNQNNLFLLKFKPKEGKADDNYDLKRQETNNCQPVISFINGKMFKMEYLHNIFGHQGLESFQQTLKYYDIELSPKKLKEFTCIIFEVNSMKRAAISKKEKAGFIAEPGEFFVVD